MVRLREAMRDLRSRSLKGRVRLFHSYDIRLQLKVEAAWPEFREDLIFATAPAIALPDGCITNECNDNTYTKKVRLPFKFIKREQVGGSSSSGVPMCSNREGRIAFKCIRHYWSYACKSHGDPCSA